MATNWTSTPVNALDPNAKTTAVTWKPDDNSLVENRMTGLLSQDSAYMQQAKTAGLQHAASRGLLNSSMAGEASQAAAIKAAQPIASQDAETFRMAGLTGAANENAANQFNASTFNQRDLNNNSMANDAGKFNASEANTTERLGTELASREKVSAENLAGQMAQSNAQIRSSESIASANRDAATITALAAKEAQILSTSGSIIAGSFDTHNAYVKSIYADPDLDAATKQQLEYNSAVGTRDAITLTSSVFGLGSLDEILGNFGTSASLPQSVIQPTVDKTIPTQPGFAP